MKKYFLIFLFLISGMTLVDAQEKDWGNLNRYAAANDSLLQNEIPVEVVLMGNSITDSWPDMRPDFFKETAFVGRGIGGQTTPQMLVRFRQDVINLSPKVVVILAGTNDIAGNTGPMTLDQIMDNIISMTEVAKANEIKVVLASILPAADYPWRPGLNPDQKIPALNQMIKYYAKGAGITYLDYFSAMADGSNGMKLELTYDGVHPNKVGYKVMEPLLKAAIQTAMK